MTNPWNQSSSGRNAPGGATVVRRGRGCQAAGNGGSCPISDHVTLHRTRELEALSTVEQMSGSSRAVRNHPGRSLRRAAVAAPAHGRTFRWKANIDRRRDTERPVLPCRSIRDHPIALLAVCAAASFGVAGASAQLTPSQGPGGPVLVVTDPGDAFGTYYAEILRAEGLNEFAVTDIGSRNAPPSPELRGRRPRRSRGHRRAGDDARRLGQRPAATSSPCAPSASSPACWASAPTPATSRTGYFKVATGPAAGRRHRRRRRCSSTARPTVHARGADDASPRSTRTRPPPTSNPAVTLRSVGSDGGQAAAFTYDLARSVVYTRQGNPAWADRARRPDRADPRRTTSSSRSRRRPARLGRLQQGRDPAGRRAAAAARQPDHADEPRPEAAAAVLVPPARREGRRRHDGRRPRRRRDGRPVRPVQGREARRAARSRTGSASAARRTSTRAARSTDAQAAAYQAKGFEIALHLSTRTALDFTPTSLEADLHDPARRLHGEVRRALAAPRTNRTHCIAWSDWASEPKVELAARDPPRHELLLLARRLGARPARDVHRVRLPDALRRPRRLADRRLPGDDADRPTSPGQTSRRTSTTLLDNALGAEGYYGVFTANMHTDSADIAGADAIVEAALARGVPIVSAKQMLDLARRPQRLVVPRA